MTFLYHPFARFIFFSDNDDGSVVEVGSVADAVPVGTVVAVVSPVVSSVVSSVISSPVVVVLDNCCVPSVDFWLYFSTIEHILAKSWGENLAGCVLMRGRSVSKIVLKGRHMIRDRNIKGVRQWQDRRCKLTAASPSSLLAMSTRRWPLLSSR